VLSFKFKIEKRLWYISVRIYNSLFMERFSSVHVQDWKEITQSYGSTYSDLSNSRINYEGIM